MTPSRLIPNIFSMFYGYHLLLGIQPQSNQLTITTTTLVLCPASSAAPPGILCSLAYLCHDDDGGVI